MEKSILDIIAQSTAKTIKDVSKLYHDAYPSEAPETNAAPNAQKPDAEPPLFSYGTSFADIMRFTRDVEIFTRHIDAQTRGDFERGEDGKNTKR